MQERRPAPEPETAPVRPTLRRLGRLLLWLLIALAVAGLLALMGPARTAHAEEKSYTLPAVEINAAILADGSLTVTEARTWDFDGSFSGAQQWIPLPPGARMTDISFYEGRLTDSAVPAIPYRESTDGSPRTFEVQQQTDRVQITWHFQAKDTKRIFTLRYRITNAVTVHQDVAELYWKFIGEEWKVGTGKAQVTLRLPEKLPQEQVRVWGHGPLHGEVLYHPETGAATWTVDRLPARTFLEGRVTFPTALVPQATHKSGLTALPSILAEEQQAADAANARRAQLKRLAALDRQLFWVLLLLGPLALVLFWFRYGRGPRPDFDGPYYREFPAEYSPAELGVLWRGPDKVGGPELSATLLDLTRRGVVTLEAVEGKPGWFGRSTQDLMIRRRPGETPVLTAHEQQFYDFLFSQVGGGADEVPLSAIPPYAKSYPDAMRSFLSSWQSTLRQNGKEHGFWSPNAGKAQTLGLIVAILAILAGALLIPFAHLVWTGAVLIGVGILLLLVAASLRPLSQRGANDKARWKAFRRFVTDFSRLDQAQVPMLILWEQYLIFATVLGVAKACLAQMKAVLPHLPEQDRYHWEHERMLLYGGMMSGTGLDRLSQVSDTFSESFSQIVKSSQSSGEGHGGGFSSGGGGGGGGGGGDAW